MSKTPNSVPLTPQAVWPERVAKGNETPRALTDLEARAILNAEIEKSIQYWAKIACTDYERCRGLALSIMGMMDGSNPTLPAIDLVLRPDPSDQQFAIQNGLHYFEDGMAINDILQVSNEDTLAEIIASEKEKKDNPDTSNY